MTDAPRATEPAAATGPCPNCGEPATGRFCPACGQRQSDRVLSLRRIIGDALDDQLSLNSALPRTLRALITRPGFLTREYIAGRIARYIPPFRLYLATSIVFFLVLTIVSSFRPPQGVLEIETDDGRPLVMGARPTVVRVDDGAFFGIRVDSVAVPDTTVVFVNFGPRWVSELATARVAELSRLSPEEIAAAVLPAMFERAPAGMFILLPVFAGLLQVAMVGRRRYYVEHFIFALHTHAFTFLALALILPFDNDALSAIVLIGLVVYWFVAMKRFYRLGFGGAVLRGLPLLVAYQVLLTFVLLGVLALALVLG